MNAKLKTNNNVYKVYDIMVGKNGFPHFLVYGLYQKNAWVYASAKLFEPV